MITIYRPAANNGVHVLMTERAFTVQKNIQEGHRVKRFDFIGGEEVLEDLHRVVAGGTMTFVEGSRYLTSEERSQHYGDLMVMDAIQAMCTVVYTDVTVSVPFSNDPADSAWEKTQGYGYRPAVFDAFVEEAKEAYYAHLTATGRL